MEMIGRDSKVVESKLLVATGNLSTSTTNVALPGN
jgi:hypothetical protein